MRRAFIKTYGCQMNEQDSLQMQTMLRQAGYGRGRDEFDADLILINTCNIRDKVVHKVYSDLGKLRPLKENNPGLIVGVAGCASETEKDTLKKRFPFIDLIFGPDHVGAIPEMVARAAARLPGRPVIQTGFNLRRDYKFVNVLPDAEEGPIKAFVNIQKGCDNVCSFCIVPFVRGREVSRPHAEIIDEIHTLVARGVREVTLLGQTVNSYGLKGQGGVSFARLLELIAQRTGIKRVRFTSSHPKDVGDDLIEQFATNLVVAPAFHLPVQSGSTRVLHAMRRQYSRDDYLEIIDKLRVRRPEMRFSTDIIVGFPGETRQDFEDTLSLMCAVDYDFCFSFAYSPRPRTAALKLGDSVPEPEKLARLAELQVLEREMALRRNRTRVKACEEVLVESRDDSDAGHRYMGRTAHNKIVHFNAGDYRPGDFAPVTIMQAGTRSLIGE
jgi:tRNA-2-methylthio-N6-dimethylallyladenosine synthase